MTILDRYILKSFLKNFLSAFFIISTIFVFQSIWLYMDEFTGKDLGFYIIAKFIILTQPSLIPIVVPFTVVLASVMTMGSHSEHYELTAMKASGISTFRTFRPLFMFMGLLAVLIFFTVNNLQPMAYKEFASMRTNIKKVQPSLAITQGMFNRIENFSIKVDRKSGENGEFLHGVTIHEIKNNISRKVIKAENGELKGDSKSDVLQLILKNGNYYQEIVNNKMDITYSFTRGKFETYIMNIDLSGFNNVDLEKKNEVSSPKSMNINGIYYVTDSLKNAYKNEVKELSNNYQRRLGTYYALSNSKIKSTGGEKIKDIKKLDKLYSNEEKIKVFQDAKESLESMLINIDYDKNIMLEHRLILNRMLITFSNKFSFALACFLLFMVAAPLGAHIKKGGLGMPIVVSVILFLGYYFIGLIINKFAESKFLNPLFAPWIPTILLLPIGVYFMIKVNKDNSI